MSEAREQAAVIEWAHWMAGKYPELALLHHIPNGGSRNAIEARNLKRQGVTPGVPDLSLPVPRLGFHGMYIEMKYGKNKPTKAQASFMDKLRRQGYRVAVCYTAAEAIEAIKGYIGL